MQTSPAIAEPSNQLATTTEVAALRALVKSLQDDSAQLTEHMTQVRRQLLTHSALRTPQSALRTPGQVSDDCARHLAAQVIAHCARSSRLEALSSQSDQRDALATFACSTLALSCRSALTTADVPLPTQFSGELRELISEFGVVRRHMAPYPLARGVARPARMGARPAFASIAMSAAFPENSPSLTLASLESHKVGGIIRLPRELDEQCIVPIGQFLARYGAVEFARLEDKWGFLADGSPNFDSVIGIVQLARDTNHTLSLLSGKTRPSDASLDDFRTLRTKVNKAALSGRLSAYYLDTTWESRLPAFRTPADPMVYQRLPNGSAILDGYGIKRSSVSRHWKAATVKELETLMQRPVPKDLLVLMIDSKFFGGDCIVTAIGIDMQGSKHVLGLWHGATENSTVVKGLLEDLVSRGLETERKLLFVLDGAKALRKAVQMVLGEQGLVQRCRVHKQRNVLDQLPEEKKAQARWRMQAAWAQKDPQVAEKQLRKTAQWLEASWPMAAASLLEGLAETLTVQRLGIGHTLGRSLSNTNLIESCFAQAAHRTRRVKRWDGPKMILRWTAAALLAGEKNFRRLNGCEQLNDLEKVLRELPSTSTLKAA